MQETHHYHFCAIFRGSVLTDQLSKVKQYFKKKQGAFLGKTIRPDTKPGLYQNGQGYAAGATPSRRAC